MAPQGSAYNTDWVVSNTSNVHLATHRDWFTTYTEFPTNWSCMPGGPGNSKARGIGTVELEMRTFDKGGHRKPSRKIILHNVLYVPDGCANVFAAFIEKEYDTEMICRENGLPSTIRMKDSQRVVGLIASPRLMRLWLKGQTKEQTSLDSSGKYYIHASWPAEERARWEHYLKEKSSQPKTGMKAATTSTVESNPPLTDLEKKYLKERWGNEFKFLRDHGLSIYDEEDRAEGRQILKVFMAADAEDEKAGYVDDYHYDVEDDDDADSVESNQFLADLESDPTSHVADYHFSDKELEWIEKHYRHSANFMRSYGLKPWDDEDCKEAVVVLRAMMED